MKRSSFAVPIIMALILMVFHKPANAFEYGYVEYKWGHVFSAYKDYSPTLELEGGYSDYYRMLVSVGVDNSDFAIYLQNPYTSVWSPLEYWGVFIDTSGTWYEHGTSLGTQNGFPPPGGFYEDLTYTFAAVDDPLEPFKDPLYWTINPDDIEQVGIPEAQLIGTDLYWTHVFEMNEGYYTVRGYEYTDGEIGDQFYNSGVVDPSTSPLNMFSLSPILSNEENFAGIVLTIDSRMFAPGSTDVMNYMNRSRSFMIAAEVQGPLATIDIAQDTMNLNARGKYVTCYIELPEPYSPETIDPDTVQIVSINNELLPNPLIAVGPTEIGDYNDNNILDLMVKFDRQSLNELLNAGAATIVVYFENSFDDYFLGFDRLKVIVKE